MNDFDNKDYDYLIKEKEQELREVQTLKIRGLETKVQEKEKQYELLELQYKELQRDFNHNLEVIRERDEDIQELSSHIVQLKELFEKKQKEFDSAYGSSQEEAKTLKKEVSELRDKQRALYEKIDDLKHENKKLKSLQSDEVVRNREEYEKKIKVLQDVIREQEETIKNSTEDFNNRLKAISAESARANENFTKITENFKREKQVLTEDFSRKLEAMQQDAQKARDEFNRATNEFLAKEKEQHQRIVDLKSKLQESQATREILEKELTELKIKSRTWDSALNEKKDFYQAEIEKLTDKLARVKAKYKNKIEFLNNMSEKKIEDLIRENAARSRRFEEEIKQLAVEREKLVINEKTLRERLQEAEHKFNKELRYYEDRMNQLTRNFEQDHKKLENEKELKDYQINQLNENIRDLQKKLDEALKAEHELTAKANELERENNMMMEELAYFRKEFPNAKRSPIILNLQKATSPNRMKETQFSKTNGGKMHRDSDNYKKGEIEDIITEKSFIDQDFPEDTEFNSVMNKFSRPGMKQSQSVVKVLNDQLEQTKREVEYYKELIEKMRVDVENVRYRMDTNNQELQVNKEENKNLKERITALQLENLNLKEKVLEATNRRNEAELLVRSLTDKKERLTEEIDKLGKELEKLRAQNLKTEEENNALKQKAASAKTEIEKLKTEREQLIEISNNLRSKINKLEDLGRSQVEVNPEKEQKVQSLQNELTELKEKMKILQEAGIGKIVGGRSKMSPDQFGSASKKKENHFSEREAFERGRNNLKESISKIKANLVVESTAKPLIERHADEDGQLPVYCPNSQKATQSQKEAEERLVARKFKKSPPKIRNYAIKDEI